MNDSNSTTHVSQGKSILSRLGGMLMRIVHVFLTLLQTSHVAVVALLIDGENISPDLTAQMLVEAGKFGGVMIRRVYGNFGESENMAKVSFYDAVRRAQTMPDAVYVAVWHDTEELMRVRIELH